MKKFNEAIETLKEFAKKGSDIAGSASTNLAAIFFLQNDLAQAQKYATIAVELDPYNAQGWLPFLFFIIHMFMARSYFANISLQGVIFLHRQKTRQKYELRG